MIDFTCLLSERGMLRESNAVPKSLSSHDFLNYSSSPSPFRLSVGRAKRSGTLFYFRLWRQFFHFVELQNFPPFQILGRGHIYPSQKKLRKK